MPDRDELDLLIESELARYAEPRSGLEQRILARVEAELPRSMIFGGWRPWALAAAVTMAIAILFIIPQAKHREAPITTARSTNPNLKPEGSPINSIPAVHPSAVGHAERPASDVRHVRESTGSAGNSSWPKLDVFPAPQPLSAQERALVAMATAPSDAERQSLIPNQPRVDSPLQISSIRIEPITMPEEGND